MTQIVIGGTHTPYIEALWQIEKEFFLKNTNNLALPFKAKHRSISQCQSYNYIKGNFNYGV
jgi:hypothetical protein